MNQKSIPGILRFMPVIFLILSAAYVISFIQPVIHFHYWQPPFIISNNFFAQYTGHPGGIADLISNFIMQSFYNKHLGQVVFLLINLFAWGLMYILMNSLNKNRLNFAWSFIPFSLLLALSNNFNFPLSVTISVFILLVSLILLSRTGKSLRGYLITFGLSALWIYYFSGSGFLLLYTLSSLIFLPEGKWTGKAGALVFPIILAASIPTAGFYLFPISPRDEYLYFFAWKPYFLEYKPGVIFYAFLLSMPLILFSTRIYVFFSKRKIETSPQFQIIETVIVYAIVTLTAMFGHKMTYNEDALKIAKADYYCYLNNPRMTERMTINLKKYSFAANLNYNLAIAKTGKINEKFFDFFQIRGSDALYPDVTFSSDLSFISTDFYYDLGYISEARHWAYESLVNFPYSLRAMQSLVKIHLVTGEYKTAEKYLDIMRKGLVGKDFVKKFSPYVKDTSLVYADAEIMEKRSFMPGENELDPNIGYRFKELLEVNPKNKRAYEYLMLFYMLNSDLDDFLELYKQAGNYFTQPVDIYEEAVLMYREKSTGGKETEFKLQQKTIDRFNDFREKYGRYGGNSPRARAGLYPEFGNTYMYYLQLVYPILLEPEYVKPFDESEPTI